MDATRKLGSVERIVRLGSVGLPALAMALTAPAHAQLAGAPPETAPQPNAPQDATAATNASSSDTAATGAQSGQLQDIVVTAQRRGQKLQDVPIAVSAFNGGTLTQSGVTSIRELGQLDSSLNLTQASGVVLPFLRGVGNPSGSVIGNEASVPVYIDEVYYSRLSNMDVELANIERVEVLKGPQGTLFGRNASGGAIQIFTRDPGSSLEVQGKLGYSNYDTVRGQLYIASPITDRLGVSLSATGLRQGDGWGKNLTTGQDTYKNKYVSVRGKIVGDLTDTTKIQLTVFYNHQHTGQGLTNGLYQGQLYQKPPLPTYGPPLGPSQLITPPSFYDSYSTMNNNIRHNEWGASAKIDQDVDFADIVSISAYRRAKELYYTDGEDLSYNFLNYYLHAKDRQISEELQLKSKPKSSFDWIIGGFYLDSRQGYDPASVVGDALTINGLQSQEIVGIQKISSLSGYGQATFHVIPENTNITLGLRYTSDRVRGTGEQSLVFPGGTVFPLAADAYDRRFTFNKLTYKVAVDHKFGKDTLGYVSISRGYKSGTFNTLPLTSDPSQPETVESYEAGLKTELFDRRLRLNGAIFQNDISNPQVQTVITTCTGTPPVCVSSVGLTNAKSARTRGVELEANAAIAPGLTAQAGFVYLDAKYRSFANAPFYFPNLPGVPGAQPPYGGNQQPVAGDASGNRLAQVPKWRLHGGLNYVWEASFGKVTFDANAAYTGRFNWDADNILKQKSYTIVNGSIALVPAINDHFSVMVWAKNLTKERYYGSELTLAGFSGQIASPAPPRTYGVEVGFKF